MNNSFMAGIRSLTTFRLSSSFPDVKTVLNLTMSLQSAIAALKQRDFEEALRIVAREKPASFGVQHFLIKGLAELSLEKWQSAADTFARAADRFRDYGLFWLNKGIAEENLLRLDDAIASQERCIALLPYQAEAYGNLSNLYRKKALFAEAEAMARRALELGANKGDAFNCLGLALMKQGKFDEAEKAFLDAHRAAPRKADILSNLANLKVEIFRFDEAWKYFAAARALEDKPVYRHDEGLARLLSGDAEKGFDLFEARLDLPNALRLRPSVPRWRGEDLKGKKLLIVAEQGFGDVLHFCRYEKLIPDGELVWAVPKSLVRLLSGTLRGTVIDETASLPACDFYIPVLSLGTLSPQPLAAAGAYLAAGPKPLLPKGTHDRKIGLVWAGSRTHQRDYERSIPLERFKPLMDSVQADFYAPFLGEALETIGSLPVARLDSLISDFADTAALLKQLDVLVTVDTAAAHLAGALGVKTFLLLPHCPDWRWGTSGEKTPLYASVTLVRQPHFGDWESVLKIVRDRLASN